MELLNSHKEAKHQGKSIHSSCFFPFKPQTLIRLKHEVKKFECDQCKYVSTSVDLLNSHKEAKHQGKALKFLNICDYVSNYVGPKHLISHRSQALGLEFECDQCKYVSTVWSC